MKKTIYYFAITIISVLIIGCNTNKNEEYTINGTLNFKNDVDSVFIYEYSVDANVKKLNSAPVIDNKFTLTGTINVPQIVLLGNMDKNFGGELILENTDYQVLSSGEDLTIKGGKFHKKVFGFTNKPEYQKLVKEYNNLFEEIFKNVDMNNEEALTAVRKKVEGLGDKVIAYEEGVFNKIINDENEETLTKLFALSTTQNGKLYPPEKKIALLNEYEKELGNHINIQKLRELMAKSDSSQEMQESVANGNLYKEVIANDVNGNPIALSELVKKNKYTLLEFWASWCSPCRGEIPNLKKAYKKYKNLGLEIYSVSIDSKREDWELALKEEQAAWPNSLVVGEEMKQVENYGVQGIPASFLIAQDGTIVASNEELREFDLDKTLSKLLKK